MCAQFKMHVSLQRADRNNNEAINEQTNEQTNEQKKEPTNEPAK